MNWTAIKSKFMDCFPSHRYPIILIIETHPKGGGSNRVMCTLWVLRHASPPPILVTRKWNMVDTDTPSEIRQWRHYRSLLSLLQSIRKCNPYLPSRLSYLDNFSILNISGYPGVRGREFPTKSLPYQRQHPIWARSLMKCNVHTNVDFLSVCASVLTWWTLFLVALGPGHVYFLGALSWHFYKFVMSLRFPWWLRDPLASCDRGGRWRGKKGWWRNKKGGLGLWAATTKNGRIKNLTRFDFVQIVIRSLFLTLISILE